MLREDLDMKEIKKSKICKKIKLSPYCTEKFVRPGF